MSFASNFGRQKHDFILSVVHLNIQFISMPFSWWAC